MIEGRTAQAIAGSVRDLVVRGSLRPGDLLPPIRALATELEVNRNTVAAAYRQLVATGAATARGRAGTVIAAPASSAAEPRPGPGLIDAASGNPDPALLPDLRATVSKMPYAAPLYGDTSVVPALEAAAAHVFADVGRDGRLTVAHGAVDAVERILASHLVRGDLVALEHPCFLASVGTVRLNGYRTAAVAVDDQGMTVDGLDRALKNGARAVIITPRAHNPTGTSLTPRRAADLRELLTYHPEVLVVEDDHFALVSARPYQRITSDSSLHWAVVRSLAKSLGPDVRVALVLSDHSTARDIGARLQSGKTWVSHLLQSAAGYLLTEPATTALLERARLTYQRRIATLTTELATLDMTTLGSPDGLNAWIDLPEGLDPNAVRDCLAAAGWAVQPGNLYTADGATHRNGIRVTTSTLGTGDARRFTAELARCSRSQPETTTTTVV